MGFVGSSPDLGVALLGFLTSNDMAPVAFKEQNQLYVALANGDLSWALSTIGSALPLMKAGKVKLIAVAAASRSPLAPEIPTIAEAGGPAGGAIAARVAVPAPRRTPARPGPPGHTRA